MHKRFTKILLLFVALNLVLSCRNNIEQRRKFIKPIPFEKQNWLGIDNDGISDAETLWKYRPGMARYLINKEILIGKSRAEIIEMLGKDGNDGFNEKREIEYELEQIWIRNIDPAAIEHLKINFNGEDKVEKAEIEFHKTGDWSDF
ncbi:MAG TPA: hypothetical protein VF721_21240 [Pyrinomonadaceae bacterium]|jgi:hypothetical protein